MWPRVFFGGAVGVLAVALVATALQRSTEGIVLCVLALLGLLASAWTDP